MSPRRFHQLALADERGSILVVATLIATVFILLGTVIIEVGHTMEHRRHLQVQTDAAALAAAQAFPLCSTNPAGAYSAMSAIANQYGGFSGATQYNKQVGTGSGYAGTVSVLYQSRPYPAGGTAIAQDPDNIFNGTTQQMTCGDPANPNSSKFFDIKATEAGVHNVFNFGLSTTVHAHSRVELKAVNQANGLLPLGVPDVRPKYVFAKFVAETGTVTCTDQSNVAVPSCEEQLTKGSVVGSQQQWVPISPLKVTIPVGDLGVRIRLVGGSNPTAACGSLYVECYDSTSTIGLIHVRGWDPAASAPVVKDVSILSGTCVPDAYFASKDCSAGLSADVNLNTAVTASSQVWATIDGANTKYQLTPSSMGAGLKTWSLGQGIPITGGGPHVIALGYNTGSGGNKSFGNVQRAYEAAPDSSGPLYLVQEYDSGANSTFGPYSYQGGTVHTLGVTVNTQGSLLLSGVNDAAIYLRVFNDSGSASQNQTIDCDPALSNLQSELTSGCAPTYKTQTALTCPFANKTALWASPQPWTCAAIQTGASVGQISHGLNQRIYGSNNPPSSACGLPGTLGSINWIPGSGFDQTNKNLENDKRVLPLFVTPLGSFQGTGSDVVPVIDFAYFYVTGYNGDPCEGNPNVAQDPVPNNRGSYVRGHFIKFFPIEDLHTSDDNCDLTSITPCVGVLTR